MRTTRESFSQEKIGKKRETKENSLNQFRKINPKQQQQKPMKWWESYRKLTQWHMVRNEDEKMKMKIEIIRKMLENFLFNKHVSAIEKKHEIMQILCKFSRKSG